MIIPSQKESNPEFEKEALEGLSLHQKKISPKFLYDEKGSSLFTQITSAKEYYLTRVEEQILEKKAGEISTLFGPNCLVMEYGPGEGKKSKTLLRFLDHPKAYLAIDISKEILFQTTLGLSKLFPQVEITPVCSDFFQIEDHSELIPSYWMKKPVRKIAVFLGSTLGNMEPLEARGFLNKILKGVGPGGGLLIGVDLVKDQSILEKAYNDSEGITAKFNLNVLERMNRELHSKFDLAQFAHKAIYNPHASRIEMHLESQKDQDISVANSSFSFKKGETLHTENSYKYSIEKFTHLTESSGWRCRHYWTDPRHYFALFFLESP